MTVLTLLKLVANTGTIASVVPVAVGVIRIGHRPYHLKVLWTWLALGMVSNLAMFVSIVSSAQTSVIAQAGYLILGLLGLYAMARMMSDARHRYWVYGAMAIYVPIWVWRISSGEAAEPFSRVAGPVLWILLTLAAALLVRSRLGDTLSRPFRDPGVLVGFAILISYSPAAALEPVSSELYSRNPELTRWLYLGRGVLLIVGYWLFTLVMLWTIPPRSSSGSSSSVA